MDRPRPEGLDWCPLSLERSSWLERHFEEEEVKKAISYLGKEKSSDPNGYSTALFQQCWSILKDEVMRVLIKFHRTGIIDHITNETYICLIPKKPDAIRVENFRPINLTSSLYKIIAKVLANRLREVMGDTIA